MGSGDQGWKGCLWGLEGTGLGGPRERAVCGYKEQIGRWGGREVVQPVGSSK